MPGLSDEHKELMEAVKRLDAAQAERIDRLAHDMQRHVDIDHAGLLHRSEIEAMFDNFLSKVETWMEKASLDRSQVRGAVDELARVVLGEAHVNIDGEVEREGGLVADLRGPTGLKFHLPWAQVWTLVGTMIVASATVIAAIIASGG